MMKDGRPYSIENGTVDAALITAHPQQEIDAVLVGLMKIFLQEKLHY